MKIVRVLLTFLRFKIPFKVTFGRNTVTLMQPIRPNPKVPYATITKLCNELELAFNNAKAGGKKLTMIQDEAEERWDAEMRRQAKDVEDFAANDAAVILSCGFEPSRKYTKGSKPLFAVKHSPNYSGVVILECKALRGKTAYLFQRRQVNPNNTEKDWTFIGCAVKAGFTDKDLTPGVVYEYRMAYVTSDGQADWCAPVSIVVI